MFFIVTYGLLVITVYNTFKATANCMNSLHKLGKTNTNSILDTVPTS